MARAANAATQEREAARPTAETVPAAAKPATARQTGAARPKADEAPEVKARGTQWRSLIGCQVWPD